MHTAELSSRPLRAHGRRGQLQLRCAHHRDRRLRRGTSACRPRRSSRPRGVRLRHLRRVLLPRAARGGRRRRQHRGRGGAVPVAHRAARDARYTAATSCAPRRSCRIACSARWRPARCPSCGTTASTRCWAMRQGVNGVRLRSAAGRAHAGASGHGPVHRHRPHAEHRAVRRPARDAAAAISSSRAASRATPPRPASPACSPPATSRTTSTGRPITSAGAGCMAALDADRYLERSTRAAQRVEGRKTERATRAEFRGSIEQLRRQSGTRSAAGIRSAPRVSCGAGAQACVRGQAAAGSRATCGARCPGLPPRPPRS